MVPKICELDALKPLCDQVKAAYGSLYMDDNKNAEVDQSLSSLIDSLKQLRLQRLHRLRLYKSPATKKLKTEHMQSDSQGSNDHASSPDIISCWGKQKYNPRKLETGHSSANGFEFILSVLGIVKRMPSDGSCGYHSSKYIFSIHGTNF